MLGVHVSFLSRLENGLVRNVNVEKLMVVLEWLGPTAKDPVASFSFEGDRFDEWVRAYLMKELQGEPGFAVESCLRAIVEVHKSFLQAAKEYRSPFRRGGK